VTNPHAMNAPMLGMTMPLRALPNFCICCRIAFFLVYNTRKARESPIPQAKNPLDNTAVHPESYCIVEQMAKDLDCSVAELIASRELRLKINPERYLSPTVGMPTLKDILQELDKPGRDPRGPIKIFEFDKNVRTINDLREGMELPGIVGNITNFGAFVDIGIKENGLVHLSQLADRFISDPNEVVSIHQHIRVKVLSIDMDRKRIQLTMKGVEQN
jgi:uncharacterized protein